MVETVPLIQFYSHFSGIFRLPVPLKGTVCMKVWTGCQMSWQRSEIDGHNCVQWYTKASPVCGTVWMFMCAWMFHEGETFLRCNKSLRGTFRLLWWVVEPVFWQWTLGGQGSLWWSLCSCLVLLLLCARRSLVFSSFRTVTLNLL